MYTNDTNGYKCGILYFRIYSLRSSPFARLPARNAFAMLVVAMRAGNALRSNAGRYIGIFYFPIKRARTLLDTTKVPGRFWSCCFPRLFFALKWLIPPFRVRIFPFFVTLSRFVNDLFVFPDMPNLNE